MAFENFIGNENVKETLKKIIESNNILHSYLFSGIDGIGKKTFAQEFAKMILCLNKEKKPCNSCKSCIQFNENNNPNFNIIESEGTIKIEQIRKMQEKVYEKPLNSNKKIYIIDNAENMTKEAQNCLLKTLEEPPEYIVIILITANESNLLNTIKSRCMKISFNKIEDNILKSFLEDNFEFQNINMSLLKTFEGSIGKAIKTKENNDLYNELEKILNNIDKQNLVNILNNTEEIKKNKDKIQEILNYFNIYFIEKSKEDRNSSYKYLNSIKIIENTKERLKYNSNFDMSMDYLFMNLWEELNN